MSKEKNISSRIQHKHDVEINWNKAINFIPKIGEIIVYDIDENYTYERMKIGDGKTTIINLPFITDNLVLITTAEIDAICSATTNVSIVSLDEGVF